MRGANASMAVNQFLSFPLFFPVPLFLCLWEITSQPFEVLRKQRFFRSPAYLYKQL